MKKSLGKLVTFFFMGPVVAFPVQAATTEKSLNVDAIVGSACSVKTTPIDFGAVGPFVGAATTGSITVNCTPGIIFSIGLDGGQHYLGASRLMSDGLGHFISYDLVSDMFGPWGDGGITYPAPLLQDWLTTGEDVFVVFADLTPQPLTTPAGFYSDVVRVTVFY